MESGDTYLQDSSCVGILLAMPEVICIVSKSGNKTCELSSMVGTLQGLSEIVFEMIRIRSRVRLSLCALSGRKAGTTVMVRGDEG